MIVAFEKYQIQYAATAKKDRYKSAMRGVLPAKTSAPRAVFAAVARTKRKGTVISYDSFDELRFFLYGACRRRTQEPLHARMNCVINSMQSSPWF